MRISFFRGVISAFILLSTFHLFGQNFTFVGAQKCKTCHMSEKRGKQYILWENSRHSKSFEVLFTDSARQEAEKQKLKEAPSESPKCLECHSPLHEKAPGIRAEGVTCEFCHGPGSAYIKMNIMKNKPEATKNGLAVYDTLEAIKTKCKTCHQSKTFDFDSSWEKIKHPIPEKKSRGD